MKVRVDPARCQAHGKCHQICPEVFLLDEWGYAYVDGDGEVATEHQQGVMAAVQACPERAIVVVGDSGTME